MRLNKVDIRPSRLHLLIFSIFFLIGGLTLALMPWSLWLKALIMSGYFFWGVRFIYYEIRLNGKKVMISLAADEAGKWQVITSGGSYLAQLRKDSMLSPLLCVLRFSVPGQRWPLSCTLFCDSLSYEDYRALLRLIKLSRFTA